MARKINIGSVAGIDAAIKFLEKQMSQEALQKRAKKIATVLVGNAAEVAKSQYPPEVEVTAKGMTLKATHPEIAFIEFGAGLATDGSGEFATNAPFPVERGSYSAAQTPPGEYAQTGFDHWHHDGVRYTEIVPQPGMEAARQFVTNEKNIEDAVREVLDHDRH